VASLPEVEQIQFLNKASIENLSVRQLREEIKKTDAQKEMDCSPSFSQRNFTPSEYEAREKKYPMYILRVSGYTTPPRVP